MPKQKAERSIGYVEFPNELEDIGFAVPFEMLNCESIYIRVKADPDLKTVHPMRVSGEPSGFNDDGFHVPIVDLAAGHIFWMSKRKPCKIVKEAS